MSGLQSLLAPASVAVVGASSDPQRIGGRPIAWMRRAGFAGAIYPVNPGREEVQGLRAYPSVAALPEAPEAAIVAVPSPLVLETIAALGARGVRAAVVFSAGFAEVPGGDGAAQQQQLVAAARRHGMRMLGPNCLGLFNADIGWYPTFSSAFEGGWPLPGRVGVVTQSGAFGSHLVCLARKSRIRDPRVEVLKGDICSADLCVWRIYRPAGRESCQSLAPAGNQLGGSAGIPLGAVGERRQIVHQCARGAAGQPAIGHPHLPV